MHRSTLGDDLDTGRRWRTVSRIAALCATALMGASAGMALDRLTSGPATPGAMRPGIAAPAQPTPSSPAVDGVVRGFPDTAAGARAAALAFVQIEGSDLMAHPDEYRVAWRRMCTARYYAADGRAIAEGVLAAQESANHLISNAVHGQRVYERAVPLTAMVTGIDGTTATVRTWSLLIAHPGDGPTVLSFAAGVMQLRWEGGDWRLDGGAGLSAPDDGTSGLLQLSAGPGLPDYLAGDTESAVAPTR